MQNEYDPTEGMSPLALLLAGIGQGMNNTALGVKQAFGQASRDDVAEQRRLDSALLGRGPGALGSVLGSTASMAPAAFVPGANTLVGAGLLGGAMGMMQPSEGPGEALRNALAFGLLGPASIAAGRGISGLLSSAPARMQMIK